MSDEMTSRLKMLRSLVPQLESSLKSFQNSNAKFRIVKTVHPDHQEPQDPAPPAPDESPKTLFILDSSFNPPTIAHSTLALSTLEKSNTSRYPSPVRFLLLFAVMNADKAPSPAAFEQRLALMTVFAKDLLDSMASLQQYSVGPIDIGVTAAPYYTDKSAAIESEGLQWYPDKPKHVHLIGFDTFTRFFGAKYYQKFSPPFSALNPYFDHGHRLRVTLRPDDDYGTEEEQRAFHRKLQSGEMEKDGARREWAEQVELVPPNRKTGVSSTKIRKAAKNADWNTVADLCTPGVVECVRHERLYAEDDRGAKMA